ncbi:MAG: TIGR01777 family oxidoreductase [Flavobacteriaceae bacterium]
MKEVVLITGGSGLVAKELSKKLHSLYSVRFLTRHEKNENEFEWDVKKGTIDENALLGVNHIIHLAGANISEKRWSSKQKKEIISSRIESAKLLLNSLKKNNLKIDSFISASAVGYYGTKTSEKIYDETDAKGDDFLSDVTYQWEQVADLFVQDNIAKRVVKLRSGVVLSESGGALPKMISPIKFYVGAILGNGKQYMPWVHIQDICSMFEFALKNQHVSGVFNACSPTGATYKEFTKTLAHVLRKPILTVYIPSFIIKLIFGESSVILLQGSRVSPNKITKTGFVFKFTNLELALRDLLEK